MKYGTNKSSFITLSFAHHKGIDAINLGNILHQTSIKSIVPTLVKDQSIPILHQMQPISLNVKRELRDFNNADFNKNVPKFSVHIQYGWPRHNWKPYHHLQYFYMRFAGHIVILNP
jgi:hypothetical protein